MSTSAPITLAENAGLTFLGESAWTPAILTARQAEKFAAAVNACGRPNADVLRQRLAVVRGKPVETWQIDFPDHFTAQEAALYEQPFTFLQQRSGGAWLNPHTQPALRRALARVSRFLALPADASGPDWRWIEDELLPDSTLLVVAREDDFMHGVLQSAPFATWWHAHQTRLDPVLWVETFPFPWPPTTALSALTSAQEECRHAIARAARGGDQERINSTVLAAYGWPGDLAEHEMFEKLMALNRQRGSRPPLAVILSAAKDPR